MTAWEHLQGIYEELRADMRAIDRKIERYGQEYSRPFGSAIRYDKDKVQTSGATGGLEEWYVRMVELEEEIDAAVIALEEKRSRYTRELQEYPVLLARFVQGFSMRRAAKILGMSRRSAWREYDREMEKYEENMRKTERIGEKPTKT